MSAPIPAGGPRALRPPPRPTLAAPTKVYPPVPPMPADVLVHPTANLMPMMTPQEFADLVERIKAHGQREPIKRLAGPHAGQWLGAIYDGRNRYLACLAAGREPIYEDYLWDGEQSLVELVLDLGLPRRSLTAAQKVIIAEDMKPLLEAEAAERRARGLLRAQQLRAQHGDGPSPSAQVDQGAAAQNGVAEAQDDGESHGGSPVQKRKRDEGGRTTAKLAKLAEVGEVSVKDVTRILNQAPDLRPVLKLKGPLSIPQARTLATKFTAEDRAVAVDRILAGEKAAAVLADMTPFSAADPALLTAKERSAARVLRGLSQERQQLVLAEGKVDFAAVPTPSNCTQPGCKANEGLRARPLRNGGLSYWCKDHDPGPFPAPARLRALAELPYVLLWSHREKRWWAPNAMGYTHRIAEAGLYTLDEATKHAQSKETVIVLLGAKAPRLPTEKNRR